jgi:hypothetical protein
MTTSDIDYQFSRTRVVVTVKRVGDLCAASWHAFPLDDALEPTMPPTLSMENTSSAQLWKDLQADVESRLIAKYGIATAVIGWWPEDG